MLEIQLQIERSIVQQVGFGSLWKEEVSFLAATETLSYPHNVRLQALLQHVTEACCSSANLISLLILADARYKFLCSFDLPHYATGYF